MHCTTDQNISHLFLLAYWSSDSLSPPSCPIEVCRTNDSLPLAWLYPLGLEHPSTFLCAFPTFIFFFCMRAFVSRGGELFVQLIVIGLTLARHISATRGGWGNPLFSLLSRDGSMVFLAIAGLSSVLPRPLMLKLFSWDGCHHCSVLGSS
jgi:hypothetical protein